MERDPVNFDFPELGGPPPAEIMELCREVSFVIEEVVKDPDLWFRMPRLNLVRLIIQSKLLDMAAEVVRLDRQREGPDFFGTRPQRISYQRPQPKPPPPLRSWVKKRRCTIDA